MPNLLDYKYPFVIVPFTLPAGEDIQTDYIKLGNFTPSAIILPPSFLTSPIFINGYIEAYNGVYIGGNTRNLIGAQISINITQSSNGVWQPLDSSIFQSGFNVLTLLSEETQDVDVHGFIVGAPFYTIGTGV